MSKARLGKRERLEKRQRAIALRQLLQERKAKARELAAEETRLQRLLPNQEFKNLTGKVTGTGSLSPDYLMASTHFAGFVGGKSMGSRKAERKPMPDRFRQSFMADGHETLKADTGKGVAHLNSKLVKVPRKKSVTLKEVYQKDWS